MTLQPTIQATADVLNELSSGSRFWFWLCPSVAPSVPTLLARALEEDPMMRSLYAQSQSLSIPAGATPIMGLGSVDEVGRISLGSPLADRTQLSALAQWVETHVPDHLALARLKNNRLINISEDGVVREVHDDPSLWDAIPAVAVPGTLAETTKNLARLKAGQGYWFWLAERGPGGAFLALGSTRRDPDASGFAQNVRRLRRQGDAPGVTLRGVVQRTPSGNLMMLTDDDISAAPRILRAFRRRGAGLAEAMGTVTIARTANGEIVKALVSAPESSPDLSGLLAILARLDAPGAKTLFWFRGGENPCLLLDNDRTSLKESSKEIFGEGPSARGTLQRARKGYLEFRSRVPYDNFVSDLITWVGAHLAAWPDLARLHGARMTHRDADHQILDRQRDDRAWNTLINLEIDR